jgi:hypothetical protein
MLANSTAAATPLMPASSTGPTAADTIGDSTL